VGAVGINVEARSRSFLEKKHKEEEDHKRRK
jgi:hypothetical protein